jgi:hypothetical protein
LYFSMVNVRPPKPLNINTFKQLLELYSELKITLFQTDSLVLIIFQFLRHMWHSKLCKLWSVPRNPRNPFLVELRGDVFSWNFVEMPFLRSSRSFHEKWTSWTRRLIKWLSVENWKIYHFQNTFSNNIISKCMYGWCQEQIWCVQNVFVI